MRSTRERTALLCTAVCLAALFGCQPKSTKEFDPSTYTYLTISDADSLDPAWHYDTHSHAIVANLYETLFAYEGSSTERLAPLVAEKVPSRENGLISRDGRTIRIPIREGIRFHDGTPLTAEDVRYSLMRFVLYDRDAGPSWMLAQPLLGYPSTRDEKGAVKAEAYAAAAKAVGVEGGELVLRLPAPYAPLLVILAQWAPVVSKSWAVARGEWDGTEEAWVRHNNPKKESSAFFQQANGTGPFKLERWDRKTKQFVLARNDDYWRGPARLKRVVVRAVPEFGTRKLMLQAGDADSIYATAPEYSKLRDLPGVRIIDDLPSIEQNPVAYFTFKVNPVANSFIGSGTLDGKGIPPDFFSDINVRKGFAYAFDYEGYIRDVNRGKGRPPTGCIPAGLPGQNPEQKTYRLDLAKAREHFQKAWGGKAWETGFHFILSHNTGNVQRETLCQMIKRSVESLNPRFRLDVRPLEWPTFLDAYKAGKLPLFILGWQADFPDAHSFAFPLLHSGGDYPSIQGYKNPEADRLIDAAIAAEPEKRRRLYFRLQAIEHEDSPHLLFSDSVRFRTQRDWVRGWRHNPMFPDAPYSTYYYQVYKSTAPEAPERAPSA